MTEGGHLKHIQASTEQQIAELDRLLLDRLRARGRGTHDRLSGHLNSVVLLSALTKGSFWLRFFRSGDDRGNVEFKERRESKEAVNYNPRYQSASMQRQ